MRLQLLTWPEVDAYLQRSRGLIVPIGATEQHSPLGLIGTDAICAETLAWSVGQEVDAIVAPTLSVGMSEHHMAFPGSMTLRPSTLLRVVRDTVLSLARHGFRRFFFLNGHGGNTATVQAAFFEVYGEVAGSLQDALDLRCKVTAWWESEAAERLSQELFGDSDGDHATASEVSLARYVYPDIVPRAELDPAPPSDAIYGCEDFRRRYPDGRMGSDPGLASAEHGAAIHGAVVADLVKMYRGFVEED
jgi:creatinine amidohydrolase